MPVNCCTELYKIEQSCQKYFLQTKRNKQISNTSERCGYRKSDIRTDIPGTSEENQWTIRPCHIHQPWTSSGRPENQRLDQGDQ